MRAHQPGSTPIDIPETVPNPAYTPAPAPERSPTKVPEKVPEKVISGIADATSNGASTLSFSFRAHPSTGALRWFDGRKLKRARVCTENLNPDVLAMKSAQYGARIYDAGSLNLARDRRIFVQ